MFTYKNHKFETIFNSNHDVLIVTDPDDNKTIWIMATNSDYESDCRSPIPFTKQLAWRDEDQRVADRIIARLPSAFPPTVNKLNQITVEW